MEYVVYALLALIVLFFAVILVRTAAFKPAKENKPETAKVDFDEKKVISDMQQLIRCKTVSYYDKSMEDVAEFDKLRNLLPKLYPNVFKACSFERVGRTGLLFKWPGKADKEPTVLMAHYDVVPVNEELWTKPAFDGLVEDGVLWGRGTLDTKGTFLGVLEAAEALIGQGFIPSNDIYFSFAGDEEVAGEGAPAIVAELEKRGVTPQLVVDEGGAVVEDIFPGVSAPCALVGIGEKGIMDVQFEIKGAGGHASAPPPHTAVGALSQAAVNIENHPFKSRLTKPVAEMFDTLGRHSSFVYRMIFANLWCFMPVLDSMCRKKGGELNALMRTTVAFTQMEGSKASNVLPPYARMVANLRLVEGDTVESAVEYLKSQTGSDKIEVSKLMGMNASPSSRTDAKGWEDLKNAISQTWPDALVSPYLMIAASDSRHFCKISDKVMRFSAMALTKEERGLIHGNDERVSCDKLLTVVKFYMRLISLR